MTRFQLSSPHLLTDAEIEEVLEHVDDLVKWAVDVKEYATKVALETDKTWSKFKLVEGRSNRKFNDEEKVAEIALANGYTDIYRKNLITLTDMERMMGKEVFNTLLGKHVTKAKGKVTLVPKTDSRKELVVHNVKQEFNVMEENNNEQ